MSESIALGAGCSSPLLESLLELDQAVLDALPIGLYACDSDGCIIRANHKACELWGRTPRLMDPAQRFCGSFRVESLAGEHIPPEATPMARAVLHGEAFEAVEARVENPDGRRWVASVTIQPLRDQDGEIIGAINCFRDITREFEQRQTLARQQQTFDLAMVASNMGTWRYTMADNVCVYDDNAQKLYGLTEARFLHDEEGVKDKFHPDDMALMWSRVAKACDPAGDGRYEVEYRVKQLDGGWRWLSAWGQVEFEGEGENRRPVAIAGASRDLTEPKKAEDLQRLMLNELNHRVKNSLATVQSIADQTLRGATDLQAARDAIDQRICSLARAHDLLTARNWIGADLREVVERVLEPYAAEKFRIHGGPLELAPQQALALSMALHELATNAAKYGALSSPDGIVELRWRHEDGQFQLIWREQGGPVVAPPTRRGFGSRLLQRALMRELGGSTTVIYPPEGVVFEVAAPLRSI
ncbi:MAG TPA: HWE histidine kinase domain-containing protein [Caulobacteraceae bacterium]|nr:HWE histidine kinase domain-containing protein [Caulobacteraceae bacterium]